MPENYQARKFQITINNPLLHGFTHEYIRDILSSLSLQYWCFADEVGSQGTPHTHIYLVSARGGIRFSTLQRKFLSVAHIESAYGSSGENRDYIKKEGKHRDKSETSILGSFEEWGTLPVSDVEKASDFNDLKQDLLSGATTGEILKNNPKHMFRATRIDEARNAIFADDYSTIVRKLNIIYYFGNLDAIAAHIYSTNSAKDIFRWTPMGTNVRFDGYTFQPILLIHGFESEIPCTMLIASILSGFPLQLPCRFHNVQAAYNTVFITSLCPPDQLYDFPIAQNKYQCRQLIKKIDEIYYINSNSTIKQISKDHFI